MKILVVDPLVEGEPDIEREVAGEGLELVLARTDKGKPLSDAIYADCDALLNCRSLHRLPAAIIAKLTRCRVIVQGGVGFNHIDLDAAAARSIPVCNTPDYGTTEVADHAVGLMVALSRGIVAYDRRLRASDKAWDARLLPTVRRLRDLRLGIVGLGRIGTAVARRAAGFGMSIGFHDPYLPAGIELAHGLERFAELDALLRRSDIVSLHCPLTEETADIIGARQLALLPAGAIVVNTARGGVLDLDAVHAALQGGRLGGAAIDVFPIEPIDRRHPLLAAWSAQETWLDDRLIVTPHAAFYSSASIRDMRRLSMLTVVEYLRHGRLRTCVNGTPADWRSRAPA